MLQWLVRLFGSKRERDIARLRPIVSQINQHYAALRDLSDADLRAQTTRLRETIQAHLRPLMEKKTRIESDLQAALKANDIPTQVRLYEELDQLRLERNREIEKILWQLLPEAFAIVKETARRLTENKQLVVPATDWDYQMAQKYGHIRIENGQAIWPQRLESARPRDGVEYDPLRCAADGGIVLHEGKIAEMATGEGKPLVATLPAYLNGLTGLGMHIVTVNDYLAKRDAEWNGPLLAFHGLSVDCIDYYPPHSEERKRSLPG